MKTLRDLLKEGVKLVPIFADPRCNSSFTDPKSTYFRIGFYYNGVPHVIQKERFSTQAEAEEAIAKLLTFS